ncbi:MAG TPA: Gfo/Idh/MocA family oxidoreductase [Bacteroidota bacterium]|nr:Gfo/Idh/MocA family oxidoreductase [Bacteroidota bacterium]
MANINAAIIGTGFIGPAHLEALQRIGGVNIVAIASNEPDKAHALAARFSIPRVYERWEEVIQDASVQVVHNCTPNNLHYAINKAAILRQKHVLSEKPLTMTSQESAELVAMAREMKIVHGVDFNYRFYPLVQQARSMVREGSLGKVYLAHGHYLQDWLFHNTDYNWRLEPSVSGASRAVADIGSHWFDLVQFITGLRVTRVCANLATVHPTRLRPAAATETFARSGAEGKETPMSTEDAAVVLMRFDNGAMGAVTVSQVSAGRKNREWFEIDGSKSALSWNQEEPNSLWVGHRDQPNEVLIKDPSLLSDAAKSYAHYPGGHPEGYPDGPKNLFLRFYDAVRNNERFSAEEAEFPTFEDGHRENLIVDAVLESNRTQRWTAVQEVTG